MCWRKCFGLALAAVLLGACAPEQKVPLRLAASAWPGYEALYLARDLGYYDERRVVCLELPTSSIGYEAFRNGSVDVIAVSLNEYFELVRGGTRSRIIAVLDRSNGADAAMATPGIRSLADLKGRRMLLPNFSVVGNLLLGHMLDDAHLRHEDVTVTVAPEDGFDQLYRRKAGDVFITFEPHKSRLAALGAHALYDSSRFPNEILDVLVVRESVFEQRREDACELTRQWFRTLDYIARKPEEAATRMGRRNGQTGAEFRQTMNGLDLLSREENRAMLGGAQPGILESAQHIGQYMLRQKAWTEPVDLRPALVPDFDTCLG